MAATIFRYDNAGHALGILPYDSATHDEALDGTDKLTVVSEISPTKRDRLVWQDDGGYWHEHMVDSTKRKHGANGARTESTCSNSINELYGVIAPGTTIRGKVDEILMQILAFTQWSTYGTEDFGVVQIELYHKSVRECLAEMCELVHGELDTYITVDNSGVTHRYLRIVRERGNKSVMRQFQYGRNVSSIMREVAADEVYTAVKGFGAKLSELDTSEYPNRLEVVVNSNMDLSRWGVSKGDGTFEHNYTTYTDAQCTDRAFLTKQCKSVLDSVSKPLVRYEFDTADVGGLWSDVRLGDRVMCVDELFNPSLELIERVSQIRRNLKGRVQCRIAIGARPNPLIDQFKAAEKTSKKSTGNGTRISSRTPTTTNGSGYDGESGASLGDIDVPTLTEPSKIAVTTPPTKTEYYANEKIDYTGIVVTLYNTDGSVYTDDWHPDGIAAFDELSFPREYAIAGEGDFKMGTVTCELLDDYFQQPAPISFGRVEYTVRYTSARFYERYEISGDFTAIGTDDYGIIVIFASENQGASYHQAHYRKTYTPETDTPDGDYELVSETDYVFPNSYTHDGKTVYYALIGDYFRGYGKVTPNANYISSVDPTSGQSAGRTAAGKTAWSIIYGDIENIESTSDVPVNWTRSDSTVLTATFPIKIKDNPFYHGETWGGGEGIDVPASSGGGKF